MLNPLIVILFGWAVILIAVIMGVVSIFTFNASTHLPAQNFLISSLVAAFIGGSLLMAFSGKDQRVTRFHLAIFVLLIWAGLPIITALPFYIGGQTDSIIHAVFEATSSLTTTGNTIFNNKIKTGEITINDIYIVWSCFLQWLGGFLSLMTVFLILVPLGTIHAALNQPIPGYEKSDLKKSIINTGKHLLPIYITLTIMCVASLAICGVPKSEAILLAASTISTSGYDFIHGGISSYNSFAIELVMIIFMLIGATSFLSHRAFFKRLPGSHNENRESLYTITIAILAGVLLFIIATLKTDVNISDAIRYSIFRAVSLLTTTGFDNAPESSPNIAITIVFILCFIGGASFSTAGGIKISRALTLMAQAHRELKRLIYPRGMTSARAVGKHFNVQIMKVIWSLLFVFTFIFCTISLIIAADGINFDKAMMMAMSALTNSGQSLYIAELHTNTIPSYISVTNDYYTLNTIEEINSISNPYPILSNISLIALMFGMILGRVEIFILIGLLNTKYWKN